MAPDRIGNAALSPELATGLDIAYENYLSNDGIFSVGIFHRNLTNVVRNLTELRNVTWAKRRDGSPSLKTFRMPSPVALSLNCAAALQT